MTLHSRPYAGEDDYELMRGLVRDIYAVGGQPTYGSIGDIDWWRSAEDDPDNLTAQLWFDDNTLVGIAWPADPQVDMFSHPHYRFVEQDMLDWAENWRSRTPAAEPPPKLRGWSFDGDTPRRNLLTERGYTRADTCLQYRSRPIEGRVSARPVPSGYVVRNVAGQYEAEQRVAVHRNAFAPSQMSLKYYMAARRMPTYRQDLDLVAVAADGTFAAFCIVWWDSANKLGVFEPVGCHSEHRRRGLASAVMTEGLRRLYDLGAHTAQVTTGCSNAGAGSLYEALGFRVVDENWAYDRVFSADI